MANVNSHPGRVEDEFLLDLLAARTDGVGLPVLARTHGYTPQGLRAKLDKIKRADLEKSCEARDVVLAGYW